MSKRDVLLAMQNFREMKRLANNAKIRSSLKILLIRYQQFNTNFYYNFLLLQDFIIMRFVILKVKKNAGLAVIKDGNFHDLLLIDYMIQTVDLMTKAGRY